MAYAKKAIGKKSYKSKPKMSKMKRNRYVGDARFQKLDTKAEKKYLDTVIGSDVSILQVGSIFMPSLNLVSQGLGQFNRVGSTICIKSIDVKIGLIFAGGVTPGRFSTGVKIMLILDTQAQGAVPAIVGFQQSAAFNSFNNIQQSTRFRTLKTWYVVGSRYPYFNTNTVSADQLIMINKVLKCNIPVQWTASDTTGALSAITTNNIFLYAIVDDSTNSTTVISRPSTSARIRFLDM